MNRLSKYVGNQQANETQGKSTISSGDQPKVGLSQRQAAIVTLIKLTRARIGLPSISLEDLSSTLPAWEMALESVPDEYLSRAYGIAATNWNWTKAPFVPDAISESYKAILQDERRVYESKKRAEKNKCPHCLDLGFQPVWVRRQGSWYSAMRPCSCESAPILVRLQQPLTEPDYHRYETGEYIRKTDIEKYGHPKISLAPKSEPKSEEELP